jgi:transposase
MPGVLRQVLIHSEISFLRLSVGCEANHFSASLAVATSCRAASMAVSASLEGNAGRVLATAPSRCMPPRDQKRPGHRENGQPPHQRRVRGLSGPSRGFPASRTRDPRHRRQSRGSQNAKLVDEFPARYPQVHIHFTPTYSSWLNQVEIWFAKIQRQVSARGIFSSVDDLRRKILRYIRHYNKTATPIRWTYRQPNQTVARSSVTMY